LPLATRCSTLRYRCRLARATGAGALESGGRAERPRFLDSLGRALRLIPISSGVFRRPRLGPSPNRGDRCRWGELRSSGCRYLFERLRRPLDMLSKRITVTTDTGLVTAIARPALRLQRSAWSKLDPSVPLRLKTSRHTLVRLAR